jgi:hypothetical protein
MKWSEAAIARALARSTFKGDLCVVDNCSWTGHECDLLVVTHNMHVVDVEIKISRSDLKADKDKAKWWHRGFGHWATGKYVEAPRVALPYPMRVWKHYYALPKDVWRDDMMEHVQKNSGVLLLSPPRNTGERIHVDCIKRAKPDRTAYRLTMFDLVDVARLASLRMWDAYSKAYPLVTGAVEDVDRCTLSDTDAAVA